MKKHVFLLAALAMAAMLVFVACGNNEDEIRIGLIAPLSGGTAVFGISSTNGSRLAIEELNEAGGLLGLPVRYMMLDDDNNVPTAVNNFQRLVHNDGVVAIVGPVTSGPTTAVTNAAVETRTPIITPTATAEAVTTPGDFIFRACFLDAQQAVTLANFAHDYLNAQTAAVLFNNSMDYATGLANNFETHFQALGGTMVAMEAYSAGAQDFRTQLINIRNANPDVLFIPEYFTTVALIAHQVRDLGIDAILLGPDGWDGVLNHITDPSLLEGSFFSSHYAGDDPDPIRREAIQNFNDRYYARFGSIPNSFAALGYDAARIMLAAIEAAGSTDNEAIIAALKDTNHNGVTGNITFDENGNPIKNVLVLRIGNGEARYHQTFEPFQ